MKMNHVGIMVGDMDKAVEFYTQALDLKVVMGNTKVIEERETAIGRMCIAVFGKGFKGFKNTTNIAGRTRSTLRVSEAIQINSERPNACKKRGSVSNLTYQSKVKPSGHMNIIAHWLTTIEADVSLIA